MVHVTCFLDLRDAQTAAFAAEDCVASGVVDVVALAFVVVCAPAHEIAVLASLADESLCSVSIRHLRRP